MLCLVGLIFALFCVDGDYALPVPNIMNSGNRMQLRELQVQSEMYWITKSYLILLYRKFTSFLYFRNKMPV